MGAAGRQCSLRSAPETIPALHEEELAGLIGSSPTVTLAGFLFGIGASVSGGMIPIFNKVAVNRGCTALTITFYTYLFALAGALIFADRGHAFSILFSSGRVFLFSLAISAANTALPLLLINTALQYLEAGRVSILGAVDPVVSTMVSVFLYREPLTGTMLLGIVLILAGISLFNLNLRRKALSRQEEGRSAGTSERMETEHE